MAALTGGVVVELCQPDWTPITDNIRNSWVDHERVFTLRHPVDDHFPMSVSVGGQPLPSTDWSYDAVAGTVTLSQLPAAGVQVDVTYTTPCE